MEPPKPPEGHKPKKCIKVTIAKHAANVANGRKSRGATSPQGRKRSSMNAMKEELYAESKVIPGESEEDYNSKDDIWCRRLGVTPDGPEAFLAESSFDASWEFKRGVRILDKQRQQAVEEVRRAAVPDERMRTHRGRADRREDSSCISKYSYIIE
jgi:hypothetical protein